MQWKESLGQSISLDKREGWKSETQMLEQFGERELQMHIASGRIEYREGPWTEGVYNYRDKGDLVKRTRVTKKQRVKEVMMEAATALKACKDEAKELRALASKAGSKASKKWTLPKRVAGSPCWKGCFALAPCTRRSAETFCVHRTFGANPCQKDLYRAVAARVWQHKKTAWLEQNNCGFGCWWVAFPIPGFSTSFCDHFNLFVFVFWFLCVL